MKKWRLKIDVPKFGKATSVLVEDSLGYIKGPWGDICKPSEFPGCFEEVKTKRVLVIEYEITPDEGIRELVHGTIRETQAEEYFNLGIARIEERES